jgi:hypothetical protein
MEITTVSSLDGPTNVTSRSAISTPSIDTTSCEVAVDVGKSRYTNSTAVHEMSIVLVWADAAVANNANKAAVSNIGTPTPIPTAACTRDRRRRRLRVYPS